MSAPVVVRACQGCGACLLTCTEHALRPVPASAVAGPTAVGRGGGPAVLVVDPARCTGCGACVEVCPVDAVSFTSEAAHPPAGSPG